MGLFSRFTEGLAKTRESFREDLNLMLNRGPKVDDEFWDGLEETLIVSDMGGYSASTIVDKLRNEAVRKGYQDAYDVLEALNDQIADEFVPGGDEVLGGDAVVLFVGVNGSGKTTTCGKIAKQAKDQGRTVILGSGDTFRAAAIEQLEVWAKRADGEIVSRERGSDPASVAFDTVSSAKSNQADVVIIDTAGRLHNKINLMNELTKIRNVIQKVVPEAPHEVLLVLDGSTGQNAFEQAKQFVKATQVNSLAITKLDGTAKGGVVLGISDQMQIPVRYIGVGEKMTDLKVFDKKAFVESLLKIN